MARGRALSTTGGRLALFLLCLASFMAVVDDTIVTVALPSIRRDLGFSGADAQWIFNGYMLAFGGLLLLSGRAADLWDRRRMFLAGLALFGVSSLLGSLSPSAWGLIFARVLQGLGAAAFVPASLSLLTATFSAGEERNRAIGVYGAMAALGFVVGMVGGGVITELLGWRWVLFVNVPVALAALLATPVAITESRDEKASRVLDVPGALTATLGLASLIYAVSEVPDGGWTSVPTLCFSASGALLLALFVFAERRSSGAAGAARGVPGARRGGSQRGDLPAVHGRHVLALRADALPAGRARPLAARGGLALPAHDPHLRRCGSRGRQTRHEARGASDGGFGPRVVGGGVAARSRYVFGE